MDKVRKIVGRGLEIPALLLAFVASLGLVAMVGIIVTGVVMRKFFNTPLFYTEEVVGLLMSMSLFLALPIVTLRSTHIHVSILTGFLKNRSQRAYEIVSRLANLVGVLFCAWLLTDAVPWLQFAIKLNLKTQTTRILLYPEMAVLPLAIALMGLIFAARFFGLIRNVELDEAEMAIDEGSLSKAEKVT